MVDDELQITVAPGGDFHPPEALIERFRPRLQAVAPNMRLHVLDGESWDEAEISETRIFVGWPDDRMLAAMPRLEWVQLPSAGADRYVGNDRLSDRIALTTASGVFGIAGAEHALALLFAVARDIRTHVEQTVSRRWAKHASSFEIFDSTIAVFGLGSIGSETARRLSALGANVIGFKRTPATTVPDYLSEVHTVDSAKSVLSRCDAAVLAMPGTPATSGLFDREMIESLKPGAIVVNVGRGSAVDQEALIAALESGRLGGAGLDVTDPEPLPDDHPLWRAPNVIIASHSMNVFHRKDERRFRLLEENLERFVAGEEPANLVDHRRGY